MATDTITKLAAAERQMNEAIRLYFERRDIVAVHTLTAASEQVFSDICVKKNIESPLRHDAYFIRDEARERWFQHLKKAENFFKHADRDPEGSLEFNDELTIWMLFDTTLLYAKLTNDPTWEATCYQLWFFLKEPDILNDCPFKQHLMNLSDSTNVSPDDFAFFVRLITEGKGLAPRWATFPGLGVTINKHDCTEVWRGSVPPPLV